MPVSSHAYLSFYDSLGLFEHILTDFEIFGFVYTPLPHPFGAGWGVLPLPRHQGPRGSPSGAPERPPVGGRYTDRDGIEACLHEFL